MGYHVTIDPRGTHSGLTGAVPHLDDILKTDDGHGTMNCQHLLACFAKQVQEVHGIFSWETSLSGSLASDI